MRCFVISFFLLCFVNTSFSQIDTLKTDTSLYRIIKTDKGELIGHIIQSDSREVRLMTLDNREIVIPQFMIQKIEKINEKDLSKTGDYVGEDRFSTRYFITTNGLPIKKGEHYIQWNLFGPDLQFGVGKNVGIGLMTSWLATPVIATAKYSIPLREKLQLAVGTLIGTSSWAGFSNSDMNFGGILPFVTLSAGNRKANLAISGGYGATWFDSEITGRPLTSVAGMVKISRKISLVFDSFMVLSGKSEVTTETRTDYNPNTGAWESYSVQVTEKKPGVFLFIPGLRWHQGPDRAFQFGFLGVYSMDEFLPIPLPMVQWYRNL
jgi:hypothetical protein